MIGRSAARRERAAYRLMQRLGAERFGEQRGVWGNVLDGIGLAVAGDEQDRLIGVALADAARDLGARQAGHDEVEDDEVGRLALGLGQPRAAVGGFANEVALFFQRFDD